MWSWQIFLRLKSANCMKGTVEINDNNVDGFDTRKPLHDALRQLRTGVLAALLHYAVGSRVRAVDLLAPVPLLAVGALCANGRSRPLSRWMRRLSRGRARLRRIRAEARAQAAGGWLRRCASAGPQAAHRALMQQRGMWRSGGLASTTVRLVELPMGMWEWPDLKELERTEMFEGMRYTAGDIAIAIEWYDCVAPDPEGMHLKKWDC
jgi:hypothetical protein